MRLLRIVAAVLLCAAPAASRSFAQSIPEGPEATPGEILRGSNGPYRANNDLLSYCLTVRLTPERRSISGSNTVRFRMLEDGTRIQLELTSRFPIEKVTWRGRPVAFRRDGDTFYVDTPQTMRAGSVQSLTVYYSGISEAIGRFGGLVFQKDPAGRPWIYTADEDDGARVWFPNKDQWRDEPQDGVEIRAEVPNELVDVSNGRLAGRQDLHDGYTRWTWRVTYPINNYDISLNVGKYVHFNDKPLGKLTLDFYALPEDLPKAREQFAQARPMLAIYNRYFGEYPFLRDGYKLIEAPYTGMEHQSAVTYGNHFQNGYSNRDWTGVGISPRFDFIIIHESGHEWFGNSVTAADRADMWIHEGFCTYAEDVYVQGRWGTEDAIRYVNGYKSHVKNLRPILGRRGLGRAPADEDQYFKAALFLNTMRSAVNDDALWWSALRGFAEHFKYGTILTEDVVAYFNRALRTNYTPVFYEYLRHASLPKLDLRFDSAQGTVQYRWIAEEPGFDMPVKAGDPAHWTVLHPTAEWQTAPGRRETFQVATDLFYIQVVADGVEQPVSPPASR